MSLPRGLRALRRALPADLALASRVRQAVRPAVAILAFARWGWRRRRMAPRPGPICVVGFHGEVIGIGEVARRLSHALRLAGAEVIDWDIGPLFGRPALSEASTTPPINAATLIIFLNPPELVQLAAMVGARPFEGRFCVGDWAWELTEAPKGWRGGFRYVDEVWACSRFVADAVESRAPAGFPVRVLPYPLPTTAPALSGGEGPVQVLSAFDAGSGFARKNPVAAVRAFRQANGSGRARLVVKAGGETTAPEAFADLRQEIGDAGDVTLITGRLSDEAMADLVARSDIILSLHRSEGFGLLMAHAMAGAKAVVATGWSGNLQFMSDVDSRLVAYDLIPVDDPQGFYRGGLWAEPDVEDAARQLERLIEDPRARADVGRRAAEGIARKLDPLTLGHQARAWLEGGR